MAPVALSATGQSNILFPAPSNYLRHADFILLETTSSFKLQVPKKAEHLLGFPPAAAPAAVAEAAEPFGRALDRSEVLAGTPPPARLRVKPRFYPALKYFVPSRQTYHFPNSSALQFSAQSLFCSDYLGFGIGRRSYLKEKTSDMQ